MLNFSSEALNESLRFVYTSLLVSTVPQCLPNRFVSLTILSHFSTSASVIQKWANNEDWKDLKKNNSIHETTDLKVFQIFIFTILLFSWWCFFFFLFYQKHCSVFVVFTVDSESVLENAAATIHRCAYRFDGICISRWWLSTHFALLSVSAWYHLPYGWDLNRRNFEVGHL